VPNAHHPKLVVEAVLSEKARSYKEIFLIESVRVEVTLEKEGLQGIEWVILRDHSGGIACG
jgi:hypothetical protein